MIAKTTKKIVFDSVNSFSDFKKGVKNDLWLSADAVKKKLGYIREEFEPYIKGVQWSEQEWNEYWIRVHNTLGLESAEGELTTPVDVGRKEDKSGYESQRFSDRKAASAPKIPVVGGWIGMRIRAEHAKYFDKLPGSWAEIAEAKIKSSLGQGVKP
jgi:hypothetical protein